MAQQFCMKRRDYSNFTLVNGSDLVQLQLSTFTNPFHIPFHRSIPYSSPLVRDAPTLFHYCEIVDLLLQATRSPRIWRWAWRAGWGFNIFVWTSIFCWFPVIPTRFIHISALSPQVSVVDICWVHKLWDQNSSIPYSPSRLQCLPLLSAFSSRTLFVIGAIFPRYMCRKT